VTGREGGEGIRGAPSHLRYLREGTLPTTFCPGCGCGTVLNCFVHTLDKMGMEPGELVAVTGIGCSSWLLSPYLRGDTLHTMHGRAIAFATGVKAVMPGKRVVVIAGDGDLAGIGGNHLVHAARRNVGLSVFLVNNLIYGMTGGQVSPTTPSGVRTTTTPYGNAEYPLAIAEVVAAAGANYVARWTTYHVRPLMRAMEEALTTEGFAFVEVLSQCPTNYGRNVGMPTAVEALTAFKERSVPAEKACGMQAEELEGTYVVGTLARRARKEYTRVLREASEVARRGDAR